jgi:hypothetical protein
MSTSLESRLNHLIHELKEIKKEIILQKFGKIDIPKNKLNAWIDLGKKVTPRWDGLSAVEEIVLQREKTL